MKRSARRIERRREDEIARLRRLAEEENLRQENEIANLKNRQLEQDVKYKSEELSSITMNVVRKNEILLNIRRASANCSARSRTAPRAARPERRYPVYRRSYRKT